MNEVSVPDLPAVSQSWQTQRAGANWFYWVAGLSLVNSVVLMSGSEWGFVFGLGIPQVISFGAMQISGDLGVVAKILALCCVFAASGVFAMFGFFARKGYAWAFIVGMVFYVLDGSIYLLAQDWISIAFHGFALFCIFKGYQALRMLKSDVAASPPPIPPPLPTDQIAGS